MFNVKFETTNGKTLDEIRSFQLAHEILFPSDYVYSLLHYNEFILADDQYGAIFSENNEELSGLSSPIFSLEDFSRVNFEWTDEMKTYYNFSTSQYFFIGDLHFNGALLIGNTSKNSNKIYVDLPQSHNEVIEVAKNFFDFINNEIKIM